MGEVLYDYYTMMIDALECEKEILTRDYYMRLTEINEQIADFKSTDCP